MIWCFAQAKHNPTGASSLSSFAFVLAALGRFASRSPVRRSRPVSFREPARRRSGEGERFRAVRRRTGDPDEELEEGERRRGERRGEEALVERAAGREERDDDERRPASARASSARRTRERAADESASVKVGRPRSPEDDARGERSSSSTYATIKFT